jgi:myo-inositol-hexaphosphate 3-phosphohydrolase
MAITALTLMKLSDTFNTLKDRINEIITKINKVDLEQSRLVLTNVETAPIADGDLGSDTAMLWVDKGEIPPELMITLKVGDDSTDYKITKEV